MMVQLMCINKLYSEYDIEQATNGDVGDFWWRLARVSLRRLAPLHFELISRLANLSFNEGQFQSRFKTAQITPLLKKTGLDKSSPGNYRPISNLNNISKILERLFLNCIRSHVTSHVTVSGPQNLSRYADMFEVV